MRRKIPVLCLVTILLLAGCGQATPVPTISPTPPEPSATPLPPGTSLRPADGMLMVQIPGGIPPGGSAPVEAFWFDRAMVSKGQYLECVQAGACELSPACDLANIEATDAPITCARWSDEKTYCEWAGGRLPTEMEWDYAATEMGVEMPEWGHPSFGFRCLVPTVQPTDYWPTQGWITSTPEEQGMDPGLVAEGIEQLELTFTEPHSLLIVRHGFLVVEEYYHGYNPTLNQDVASVNKSFLSALIGIAIEQGAIPGVDQRMMDYFPEYATPELDPRADEVTIEDLLTMTSGFYWPENEPVAPTYIDAAFSSGRPQDTLLRSEIMATPGTRFNYCTACTHVLSIILQKATGMQARGFAQEYLMDPLGISAEDWAWNQVGMGYNSGGWGFYLTPRDMARFGYLYLHNGAWDGEQIVPEDWARTSHRSLVDLGQRQGYGYLWWTTMIDTHPAYYALGHGGQYIFVLPTLDLIVVVTQETALHHSGDPAGIIQDYFAPAVLGP